MLFGGHFAQKHLEKKICRHLHEFFREAYVRYGDLLRGHELDGVAVAGRVAGSSHFPQ